MPKPQKNEFKYKVFISYSSEDSAWAERLSADLEKKGIPTFLDKSRLQVGQKWEPQLRNALSASQHLIVLWSDKAKESDWVRQEQTHFFLVRLADDNERVRARHRFIMIELQGESQNAMYKDYQAITDLRRAGVYGRGFEEVDPELWRRMIGTLERQLKDDDESVPVPVIVLTTTEPRLRELKAEEMPTLASERLDEVIKQFGVEDRMKLKDYYGHLRDHWRPFGSTDSVRNVLDGILAQINEDNEERGALPYRWEHLGEEFWVGDDQAIRSEAKKLERGPAVIVIDPVALYVPEVRERLGSLSACFRNEDSLIMVLAPFTLPPPCTALRRLVQEIAWQIYEYTYELPRHARAPFAHCSAQTIDSVEVKRLLQTALVPRSGRRRPPPSTPYIRQ